MEDIITSSGLGALIEMAKEDLEKQEAVIRSLQHGSIKCAPENDKSTAQTTGGTCSKPVNTAHAYHRFAIMTAAPEGEPRKIQLQHFREIDHLNIQCGLPWNSLKIASGGMDICSDEFETWLNE